MAGNVQIREAMQLKTPRTYTALTHLVVALDKALKDFGKKTWFGNDKGVKAYAAMLQRINELVIAMTLDGVIRPSTSPEEVVDRITEALAFFAQAHPNWDHAYGMAYQFFNEERDDAIFTIERMR